VLRLARTLRAQRADVVHGYLGGANLMALLTQPVHRSAVVWGVRASDIDMSTYHWISRLDNAAGTWLSRFPRLIIANSHAGQRYVVAQGYPAKKTLVIPNGIDTDRFRPEPAERQRLRAEWGVRDDELLVGRIGRFAPQKDYPTFLRAAAAIARSDSSARFVCVGAGPEMLTAELQAMAGGLGITDRLIWAGARNDMLAVYNALDLTISSSAYGEGTPNVVAEAMACGVPCVVTDVGDCAATVGELGRVVPPGDHEAIASAALATFAELRSGRICGSALRDRIVRSLSIEQLVTRSERALATAGSGREQVARLVNEASA
jgi:glycosyltransferase involved in cell wall biosynthesis